VKADPPIVVKPFGFALSVMISLLMALQFTNEILTRFALVLLTSEELITKKLVISGYEIIR